MKIWPMFALMALALYSLAVYTVLFVSWDPARAQDALHFVWGLLGAAVFLFTLAIFIGWLEKGPVRK